MPFLQAIFCLKGFDDRKRFFATSLFSLFGFIFFSILFSEHFTVNFAILLILTTVLTFSTKRRLHDAKLNKKWQLVPAGLLLLTGFLILLIDNNSSYYLLIFPTVSAALLLTYPSKNQLADNNYILGYYGPVNLSRYIKESVVTKSHNQRIEPTLVTEKASEQFYMSEAFAEHNTTSKAQSATDTEQKHNENKDNNENNNNNKKADIGELIRLRLLSNRKFQLSLIAGISLIFIGILVMSAFNAISQSDTNPNNAELDQSQKSSASTSPKVTGKNVITDIIANKGDLLVMPDNFNLYLSAYRGIIIHWKADQVANGQLWSLLSASGDKSCQSITFNKGAAIRPLAVLVEQGNEYFASFSPLDSQELIQALAFRGNFSLCGYSFSLKGSQAVLGKNSQYAPFLEKDA